jgi:phosphatidate cytidylyltransferase
LKELLIRTLTGITLIVFITGSILLGPESFALMLLLVYLLGAKELFELLRKRDLSIRWFRTLPGILLLVIVYAVFQLKLSLFWFLLPPAIWLIATLRAGISLAGTLAFLWLGIPLSSYLALGWMHGKGEYQYFLPLAVIALIWINDTFAYLTGSLLGRHKMTPLLSPGKTWEGFIGGMLISLFAGWITWKLSGIATLWAWFGISMLVSLLGLAGDLFESGLKRTVKVKNTGGLLPGHGGILDRFDSLLFVSPAVLILMVLIKLVR